MRIRPTRIIRLIAYVATFFFSSSIIFYALTPSKHQSSNQEAVLASFLLQPRASLPFVSGVSNNELVSWEDENLKETEAKREGPGEQGRPVRLVGPEKKISEKFFNQNGFNIYISDKIAVDRAVGDIRHPRCKSMSYLRKLPTASIIVPFFEEHWSTLLRTFVGVLKRTPNELIKEVILVDDGSTLRPELKDKLDNYLKTNYPDGLVRVIHSPSREGLIRARITGAKAATGDVLVFLDSHCEPSHNWLPPLLDPIARDYRTVVCPFIDVIDADTFEYRAQDEGARGAFDWELYYKRLPKLPKDEPSPELPFDSPVMAGGLFAISSKWFWELGGYDPGLEIWGGEQYELSFKLWMCGGRMIDVPCSRVGHIYRKHPTNFPSARGKGDFVGRNYKRVAEVWMDEYKEYIYNRRPHYRALDTGDLSEQHAVRERLKCRSFKWFMTEVAFDLTKKYPLIDPIPAATGDIRSVVEPSLCIEALEASEVKPIRLSKCVRDGAGLNGMQKFELSYHDDIRPVKLTTCLDVSGSVDSSPVNLFPCHFQWGNQKWRLRQFAEDRSVQIIHVKTSMCLGMDVSNPMGDLFVASCSDVATSQRWFWENVRLKEAERVNKVFHK